MAKGCSRVVTVDCMLKSLIRTTIWKKYFEFIEFDYTGTDNIPVLKLTTFKRKIDNLHQFETVYHLYRKIQAVWKPQNTIWAFSILNKWPFSLMGTG